MMEDLDSKYSAEDARRTSNSLSIEKHSKILIEIITKIKIQAGKGEQSCTFFSIPDPVQDELRKRGFKLHFYQCDSNDPRERDYFTISW